MKTRSSQVVCWTCDREVACSAFARSYCALVPTQHAIPLGLVNEYQRKLRSKWAYHAVY